MQFRIFGKSWAPRPALRSNLSLTGKDFRCDPGRGETGFRCWGDWVDSRQGASIREVYKKRMDDIVGIGKKEYHPRPIDIGWG